MVLLVVNVYIDFLQESKALSALKAIKTNIAKKTLVLRDGQWEDIDARELVPGDLKRIWLGITASIPRWLGHSLIRG